MERVPKLIITIDNKIKVGKLLYDVNKYVAKLSTVSSGKIDQYEHLTGKKMLAWNQIQMIEYTKFAYSSLEKTFKKNTQTTEIHEDKQAEAIKDQGDCAPFNDCISKINNTQKDNA